MHGYFCIYVCVFSLWKEVGESILFSFANGRKEKLPLIFRNMSLLLWNHDISRHNITYYDTQHNNFEGKLRSYFERTKGTSTPPHGRVTGCLSWVIWRREIRSAHNKIMLLVPLQCPVNGILISLNVLSSNPTSSAITKGCCVIRQNWYPPIAIFNSVQASIIVEYEFLVFS